MQGMEAAMLCAAAWSVRLSSVGLLMGVAPGSVRRGALRGGVPRAALRRVRGRYSARAQALTRCITPVIGGERKRVPAGRP